MSADEKSNGSVRRLVIDVGLVAGMLTIAALWGADRQRLTEIERRMSQRGAVQISMEADRRLTILEQRVQQLERH